MTSMALRLAGYAPKRIVTRPSFLADAPTVVDVCSVGHCMSAPSDDWRDHWLHNELGLFDSPDLAMQVVPPHEEGFTIFGYRIGVVRFRDGIGEDWTWPALDVEEPSDHAPLGYAVVGRSEMGILGCEHSPLSCNGLAAEYPVNAHCLFDELAAAIGVAKRFSIEQPEPGLYYVAEVLAPRRSG